MEGYSIVTNIGKGSSGAVYLARSSKLQKLVAIKKIEIDETRRSRCIKSVVREANILRTLNHYHIVRCYEWFLDEKKCSMSMVLEYCNGGTMQDHITITSKNNKTIEEEKILEWLTQITSAVAYIHERKILHRDLKSENVFLMKNEVVKLGDFGISKEIGHTLDKASTCVGTPCYLSPELCQDIPYSFKSDIWALGCLLFEMSALQPAFDAANLISLFYKIVNGKYSELPVGTPDSIRELIAKMLRRDPEERPEAESLLQHPALKKYHSKICTRTPELTGNGTEKRNNLYDIDKDLRDLSDLDYLLRTTQDTVTNETKVNSIGSAQKRSLSVYGEYNNNNDGEQFTEIDCSRPQTCPDSARVRKLHETSTDTVATWSGYGDRGSRRPSGRFQIDLSSSSDEDSDPKFSDYISDEGFTAREIKTQRKSFSDEFSSYSDDDLNTSRTIDDEIPEMIEIYEEGDGNKSTSNVVTFSSGGRNLPGSAWLQSKRAQVLRNKQTQPLQKSLVVSTVQRSVDVTDGKNFTPKINGEQDKKRNSKKRLPGSSWLKNGGSSSEEFVLGDQTIKSGTKKKKRLPGSGWLLGKNGQLNNPPKTGNSYEAEKDLALESCSSANEFSSSDKLGEYEYVDDFEDDYDSDFELDDDFDRTRTLTDHISTLEAVKQDCIEKIGDEVYHSLIRMFRRGLSIGEVYEKHRENVDFEMVETCYLLIK